MDKHCSLYKYLITTIFYKMNLIDQSRADYAKIKIDKEQVFSNNLVKLIYY